MATFQVVFSCSFNPSGRIGSETIVSIGNPGSEVSKTMQFLNEFAKAVSSWFRTVSSTVTKTGTPQESECPVIEQLHTRQTLSATEWYWVQSFEFRSVEDSCEPPGVWVVVFGYGARLVMTAWTKGLRALAFFGCKLRGFHEVNSMKEQSESEAIFCACSING